MKTEELLAHEDFVRRLARRLVSDEHGISDITQQAWLAVLERPPSSKGVLRSWLSKVTRNLAITRLRSDARRIERERAAAVPEGIPSSEEFAALEEVRREVVQAIFELDDLHRTVIFLRFYQELPWIEIAQRVGAPVETVRSRLKRGLAKLRLKLDKKFGDRNSWCLALAPLIGLKVGGAIIPTAVSTASTVSGGLLMATKLKAGLAAVFVLVASLVVWQVIPENSEDFNHTIDASFVKEERSARDELVSSSFSDNAGDELINDTEDKVTTDPILPTGVTFSGQVVDMVSGEPVTVYRLQLWEKNGDRDSDNSQLRQSYHDTINDPEGRFQVPLARGGKYRFSLYSSTHLDKSSEINISNQEGFTDVQYRLDPGIVISGLVLDAETMKPVGGAIVGSRLKTHLYYIQVEKLPTYTKHSVTDAEGRFSLGGLDWHRQQIAAVHQDFAEGYQEFNPDESYELVILLKKGFRIAGTVLGKSGNPTQGVVVEVSGPNIPLPRPVLTQADGTYRSPPVSSGRVTVTATGLPSMVAEEFTPESISVDVVDRDVQVDFGSTNDYVTWRGVAFDYDGSPIPNLEISLEVEELFHNRDSADRRGLTVRSEEDGAFEFGKLYPGIYSVRLEFPRRISTLDWDQITFEKNGLVQKNVHILGSVINGKLIEGGSGELLTGSRGYVSMIGYNSDGSRRRCSSYVDGNGRFTIRGVPPGEYTLRANLSNRPTTQIPFPPVGLNEIIDDVEIVVPVGGTLKLKLRDQAKAIPKRFRLSITRPDDVQRGREYQLDAEGMFEYETLLETGRWRLVFYFPGVGVDERVFSVTPGKETVILLDSREFKFYDGTISVRGEIVDFRGAPLQKAKIRFMGEYSRVPKLNDPHVFIEAETDESGRFEADGFVPGAWDVYVQLSSSLSRNFPAIWIPAQPTDPFRLRLVIPQGGTIKGHLIEKGTGLGFKKDGSWRGSCILLSITRSGEQFQSPIQEGGWIEFTGVPAGSYRLKIDALAFRETILEPFSLADGQLVDLGEIPLSPGGQLTLKVSNQRDEIVSQVNVEIWNEEGFSRKLGAGIPCSLRDLPIGKLTIRVAAEGYQPQERQIQLKAHSVREVIFTLEP